MTDFTDRLDACISVEVLSSEIYKRLAMIFPNDYSFFMDLATEEENHAAIINVAKGFHKKGKLPEHFIPDSLSSINDTLHLAQEIRSKLNTKGLTLKEALGMAFDLEMSIAENYLQHVLNEEPESEIIKRLRTLQLDSEHHANKIKDFMASKGFE